MSNHFERMYIMYSRTAQWAKKCGLVFSSSRYDAEMPSWVCERRKSGRIFFVFNFPFIHHDANVQPSTIFPEFVFLVFGFPSWKFSLSLSKYEEDFISELNYILSCWCKQRRGWLCQWPSVIRCVVKNQKI